ncbi:MAG: plasmid pRiA4b ORF-3 family protein, partial [Actinomycetota bacterium]
MDRFFGDCRRCEYEYDFGDSWMHEIIIEKRLKDNSRNKIPKCLGGARARPPEDVGGIGGYGDFIETIGDRYNPRREEMLDWAEKDTRGHVYDPDYFNINEANRKLFYALENDYQTAAGLLTGKGLTG